MVVQQTIVIINYLHNYYWYLLQGNSMEQKNLKKISKTISMENIIEQNSQISRKYLENQSIDILLFETYFSLFAYYQQNPHRKRYYTYYTFSKLTDSRCRY